MVQTRSLIGTYQAPPNRLDETVLFHKNVSPAQAVCYISLWALMRSQYPTNRLGETVPFHKKCASRRFWGTLSASFAASLGPLDPLSHFLRVPVGLQALTAIYLDPLQVPFFAPWVSPSTLLFPRWLFWVL